MLEIRNLKVGIENKIILNGINLKVNKGEIHAIMGPNGSGKSTLAQVIAGREEYKIIQGEIIYNGVNIQEYKPEERAQAGIFLAFQYPVEIPGVSTANFLKSALNSIRKHQGKEEMDALEMLEYLKERMRMVDMDTSLLNRAINEGFSGGEKKRNEIFQMAVLNPELAILDETDSGLDIDALKIVAKGVSDLHNNNNATVIVTHYQRLLNYIIPDFVHILYKGIIVKSGGKDLAIKLEEYGYDWIKENGVTDKI